MGKAYTANIKDCRVCALREGYIKRRKGSGELKRGRTILVREGKEDGGLCREMKKKMDRIEYQDIYSRRIQIIEPVFADISYCKGMDRFTLRGKEKVNGRWRLYCAVHNLGKCLGGYNTRRRYA
jgi:hypothetical protein